MHDEPVLRRMSHIHHLQIGDTSNIVVNSGGKLKINVHKKRSSEDKKLNIIL